MARCQRYFYKVGAGAFDGATTTVSAITCQYYSTIYAYGGFRFATFMRTTPTFAKSGDWTVYSAGGGATGATSDNGMWHGGASLGFNTSAGTVGNGANAYANTNSFLTYTAEL